MDERNMLVTLSLPAELRKKMKIEAINRNTSFSKLVALACTEWMERNLNSNSNEK